MQKEYVYKRIEPIGENFDPQFIIHPNFPNLLANNFGSIKIKI